MRTDFDNTMDRNIITVKKITDKNGNDYFERDKERMKRIKRSELEVKVLSRVVKVLALIAAIVVVAAGVSSIKQRSADKANEEKWEVILQEK